MDYLQQLDGGAGYVILFGFSVFLLAYLLVMNLMSARDEGGSGGRKGGAFGEVRYAERLEAFQYLMPFVDLARPLSAAMLASMSGTDVRELQKKIEEAGVDREITLDEFIGLRFVAGGLGMMFGLMMIVPMGPHPMILLVIMMLGMIGFVSPTMWLNATADERRGAIFRGLCDTLDVLAVCVSAGLELRTALGRVVDIGSEPRLDYEIERTLQEVDKGGKSLRQSFEDLRDRVNLPEMTAFVNVILMAFQMGGVGMSAILFEQAEAIRKERITRAENTANKMPSKILFPIAVFIFPAVFAILLGPMVLQAYLDFGR